MLHPEMLVGKKLRRSSGKARGAHASPQNVIAIVKAGDTNDRL
jgi:hypothetical protein